MSRFSNCLTQVISESGKAQSDWAKLSGLSQSILSRYCVGAARPDVYSLEKLCTAQPTEVSQRLVFAYIQDDIPESLRDVISVDITQNRIREDKPAPADFNALDRKTQKAFLHLIKLAIRDTDAQAAIQSSARYLGCKI